MGDLPQVSGDRIVRALKRAGWFEAAGGSGSHRKLRHHSRSGTVVVAVHGGKPVPGGTLRGILDDAGMSVAQFKELL